MMNNRYATNGTAAMKPQQSANFTVMDCRNKHLGLGFCLSDLTFNTELNFDYEPLTLEEAHVSRRFFHCTIAVGILALLAILIIFA